MRVKYSNHISWQLLNDIVFIVDEEKNILYKLENVSKEFWLQINKLDSVEEIVQVVADKYAVAEEIIRKDLVEFVNELDNQKLVILGG